MNKLRLPIFVLAGLLLIGCQKEAVVPCQQTGFTDTPVCPVSFFQVLGGTTHYNGKIVRIEGFIRTIKVGESPRTFLYFSEEQANIRNTFGAIEVGELANGIKPGRREAYQKVLSTSQNTYVEIIGELAYSSSAGMDVAPAKIENLVGVRVAH
jgi:hypothetical protein